MELKTVTIENPEELNFILGHSHFIKTIDRRSRRSHQHEQSHEEHLARRCR